MFCKLKEKVQDSMEGNIMLNIIHMISSCGKYTREIIDQKMMSEIRFADVDLKEKDGAALGVAIHHCTYLYRLLFSCCTLDAEFLKALHTKLENSNVQIYKVCIESCQMTKNGFYCFGQIVQSHGVKMLNIEDCGLDYENILFFKEGLGRAKITKLSLYNNQDMGADGFAIIGEIVKNTEVSKLQLQKCGLDYGKLYSFVETSGNSKIIKLDVSCNEDMTVEAIGCLNQLVKNHSVEELVMEACDQYFKDLVAAQIFSVVAKYLDISGNNIAQDIACLQEHLRLISRTDLKVRVDEYTLLNAIENAAALTENISFEQLLSDELELASNQGDDSTLVEDLSMLPSNLSSTDEPDKLPISRDSPQMSTEAIFTDEQLQPSSEDFQDTKVIEVDHNEKKIEVGGCFVTFKLGTFMESQTITIATKMDLDVFSHGEEVITPTLDIRAINLQRPAKIQLHTWCVHNGGDQTPIVKVWHYSVADKKWDVIHKCPLPESRYIEFECKDFSPIKATLEWIISWLTWSYVIQPNVYFFGEEFYIALLLHTDLAKDGMLKTLKNNFGEQKFRCQSFRTLKCKRNQTIKSRLQCNKPKNVFFFDPASDFEHKIEDVIQGQNYTTKFLDGKSFDREALLLKLQLIRNDECILEELFKHTWNPSKGSTSSLSTEETSNDCQEHSSRTDVDGRTSSSKINPPQRGGFNYTINIGNVSNEKTIAQNVAREGGHIESRDAGSTSSIVVSQDPQT